MKLTRDDVLSACEHLGITTDIDKVTQDEVVLAYRKALRAIHPDTMQSTLSTVESADKIVSIRAARNMLFDWIDGRPNANCASCGGTGFIQHGFGFSTPCPRCQK